MSRIGKQPVTIPSGVTVSISGNEVRVKGPKGEAFRRLNEMMTVKMDGGKVVVEPKGNTKMHRSLYGLSRTLVANMVEGVTKGFEKGLEISGVGYRVQKAGEALTLQVGFTRPVTYEPPKGISFAVEGTTKIKVQGVDKELVGEVAATLRAARLRDPYKTKGIKYAGERVQVKAGKSGKAAGGKK
ncbi:MAG: 50S ribosomal protein L6 [Chloroflexi bacterium]|nr:50S ribosomal protein L6 [Chloroflexota bacterium]